VPVSDLPNAGRIKIAARTVLPRLGLVRPIIAKAPDSTLSS
jgi:hypothetical protein